MTPKCVTVGYASVDLKFHTAPFEGEGRTTLITQQLSDGPEPGAASYFARSLANHGLPVDIITWVGADEPGQIFIEQSRAAGVGTRGIAADGTASPVCHMFYSDTGGAVVYYYPGALDQGLRDEQRQLIAAADVALIGIGPAGATADALTSVDEDALLMWAVKSDPASLPPSLMQQLAHRADVICHNEAEREFLSGHGGIDIDDLVGRGTITTMTTGPGAVVVHAGDKRFTVPAEERLDVLDATGAGDTFAGSLLSRLVTGGLRRRSPRSTDLIRDAVVGACRDARALLKTRDKGQQI